MLGLPNFQDIEGGFGPRQELEVDLAVLEGTSDILDSMVEYFRKLWRKKNDAVHCYKSRKKFIRYFLFFNKKGKMITAISGSTKRSIIITILFS